MSESVKVIVRCRPLNEKEDTALVVNVDQLEKQVVLTQTVNVSCPRKVFTFDSVYGACATNEEIYNDVVSPLVDSILLGYNGCVFAYGQTSCGKTFSMQGFADPPSQQGVMNRTFEQIFEHIQTTDVTYYAVRTSYLEIYNEEIRDLLHKQNTHKLDVKEHPEKGVYVKDLTTVDVTCVEDMEEVLEVGSWNRVLGATAQNPDSSRSHCIFTVEFELCFKTGDEKEHFRSGRLNLVDLAGSERQRYSRSEGERFKEATKINLSLSALGNVISALVKENAKHIPYRASKLTRLLQDSLGGNSRTLMIACVSPGENNYGETLSTLRYANRAKNIKNRPRMNEDPKDKLIRQYQEDIKILQQLLSSQLEMTSLTEGCPPMEASKQDKAMSVRSILMSKKESFAYEQTIANLKEKYACEHISRERLDTALKAIQADYNNYRLKHEYKMQKLQSEFKMKIKKLRELAREVNTKEDGETDDSGYVSPSKDDEILTYDSTMSDDKQDKGTVNSPMGSDNSHLWSYQWLRCYCDSSRKSMMNRPMGSLSQELLQEEYHCICVEQIKDNGGTEKGSQTCQICITRAKVMMENRICGDNKAYGDNAVTTQPDWGEDKGIALLSEETQEKEKTFLQMCCLNSIKLLN